MSCGNKDLRYQVKEVAEKLSRGFKQSDLIRKGSQGPLCGIGVGVGEAGGRPGAAAGIQAREHLSGSRALAMSGKRSDK